MNLLIEIIPVEGIGIINSEIEYWQILEKQVAPQIKEGDILISAHTPWSRVFGPKFVMEEITPSQQAIDIANQIDKDPRKVEIVLSLSNRIEKIGRGVIIAENKSGTICANSGADESNAGIGNVIGVPDDPDLVAQQIRQKLKEYNGIEIPVIISDTVGRVLRRGAVNIAIGIAGMAALKSEIGKHDLFGYVMRVSEIAIADELASAAELLQGQTDEGIPFVIIRGYKIDFTGEETAKKLNRPVAERLYK